jgi:hypothetical protein
MSPRRRARSAWSRYRQPIGLESPHSPFSTPISTPVEQRKADRERELEVRTTRQLRDKRADLRRGPAARVEQSLEPRDRMTVGRHPNTCSHD